MFASISCLRGLLLFLFVSSVALPRLLLAQVAAIVVTIWYFDWAMTPMLGKIMFVMYFAYVAQALALTPAEDWAPTTCTTDFSFNFMGF